MSAAVLAEECDAGCVPVVSGDVDRAAAAIAGALDASLVVVADADGVSEAVVAAEAAVAGEVAEAVVVDGGGVIRWCVGSTDGLASGSRRRWAGERGPDPSGCVRG